MNETPDYIQEYLSEFDDLILFDSEECSVCGIKISEFLSTEHSPLIEVLTTKSSLFLNAVCNELKLNDIQFKVLEFADLEIVDSSANSYKVSVPFNAYDEALDITKKLAAHFVKPTI